MPTVRQLILTAYLLTVVVIASPSTAAESDEVPASMPELPADCGLLNVRGAAYGAVGDGKTDDTVAIQKALSEALDSHRIVYLPVGIYLVSDSLRWWRDGYNINQVNGWGAFLQLQGQSRSGTVIRLKDHADGFTQASAPKPVIATGSRGYHGNKGYRDGEGNEAFENHIRDLTIDTGVGNAGAVGINYQVSNCGALRNVTIRSSDPQQIGAVGIDLQRRDNGPGLIADVLIDGFDVGIRTQQDLAQMSIKNLTLRRQRMLGISNHDAILTINGLMSQNSVTAVENTGVGLLTLVGAKLSGGAATTVAVRSDADGATLLLRDMSIDGYRGVLEQHGTLLTGQKIAAWSSSAPVGGTIKTIATAWLPVEQAARFKVPALTQWAVLSKPSGDDDSAVIQSALNSGKPVVALGAGRWFVTKPLTVPATVRLITGLGAEIDTAKGEWPSTAALLNVIGGKANEQTIIERFCFGGKCPRVIDHTDARTMVLRDLLLFSGMPYRNASGSKRTFIENVAGSGYAFGPGTKIWADQLDTEGHHLNYVDQAQVLAFGYKHEGGETLWTGTNGTLQLFGGLVYSFGGIAPETPIFTLTDCHGLFSMVNVTYVGNGAFPVPLRSKVAGTETEVRADQLPHRGGGYIIPLAQVK